MPSRLTFQSQRDLCSSTHNPLRLPNLDTMAEEMRGVAERSGSPVMEFGAITRAEPSDATTKVTLLSACHLPVRCEHLRGMLLTSCSSTPLHVTESRGVCVCV